MAGTGSMSETRRVFLAIQGQRFPREGDHGLYTSFLGGIRLHGEVVVVRVSASGKTIWTRFANRRAQVSLGRGLPEHRWWRVPDDELHRAHGKLEYGAGGDSRLAPCGHVSFPAPDELPPGTL